MNPYIAIFRRDLRQNVLAYLCLLMFFSLTVATSGTPDVKGFILLILFASASLMQLGSHNYSTFNMLLPNIKHYEFNYAVLFSSTVIGIICIISSNSFVHGFMLFSCTVLIVSALFRLGGVKSPYAKILIALLAIAYALSFFVPIEKLNVWDSILEQQIILGMITFPIAILSLWLCRKLYMQPKEHIQKPIVAINNLFNIKVFEFLQNEKQSTLSSVWGVYTSAVRRMLASVFYKHRQHDSLYPKHGLADQTSAVLLLLLVVVSLVALGSRAMGNDLLVSDKNIGVILILSLMLVNIVYSLGFASNKKLMAYMWLQCASVSRKKYMTQLVKLYVARLMAVQFLLCGFSLCLPFIFSDVTKLPTILTLIAAASFITSLFVISFALHATLRKQYSMNLVCATVFLAVVVFLSSWMAVVKFASLSFVIILIGAILLTVGIKNWRNGYLELR